MKTTLAILLAIVLGIGLGYEVASLRIKMAPWNSSRDEGGKEAKGSMSRAQEPAPLDIQRGDAARLAAAGTAACGGGRADVPSAAKRHIA